MSQYNQMPENSREITGDYQQMQRFHQYVIGKTESRQPKYTEKPTSGCFSLRLFWVNREKNLGFGIADDWKSKTIRWFLIGNETDWNTFEKQLAIQFSGDNS